MTLFPLPKEVAEALRVFLFDNPSGNVTLNIQQGVIRGMRIERIISLK